VRLHVFEDLQCPFCKQWEDEGLPGVIDRVRAGDLVHIRGYLVNAHMPDGGEWRTSTTRSDSGAGACELVWVEDLEIAPRR